MKRLTNTARNLAVFFLTFMVVSFVALLVLSGVANLVTGETMWEAITAIDGSVSQEDLRGFQIIKISYDPQMNRTTLFLACKIKDCSAVEGQLRNILKNYSLTLDVGDMDGIYYGNLLNALLLTPAVGFMGTLVLHTIMKKKRQTQRASNMETLS